MNIALCLNANYIMPSLVCMLSVVKHNSEPITFYLLHTDLTPTDLDFISLQVQKVSAIVTIKPIPIPPDTFNNVPTYGRSKEAYFRLLIPTVLPQHIYRCLYLDSDILVKGSLTELYEHDFQEKALVVCQDMGELLMFHKQQNAILNIPSTFTYFNSGVLLFNMPYFRKNLPPHLFTDYITKHSQKLTFLDQDVLNGLLYDKVTFANAGLYNYMEILLNPLLTSPGLTNARIIHFIQKPWKWNYIGTNSKLWWHIARPLYPTAYIRFSVLNFIYRKCLAFITFFISIDQLKNLKKKLV